MVEKKNTNRAPAVTAAAFRGVVGQLPTVGALPKVAAHRHRRYNGYGKVFGGKYAVGVNVAT